MKRKRADEQTDVTEAGGGGRGGGRTDIRRGGRSGAAVCVIMGLQHDEDTTMVR